MQLPTTVKFIEEDETETTAEELPPPLTDELETPEGDEMATDEEEMPVSVAELLLTPEELTLLEEDEFEEDIPGPGLLSPPPPSPEQERVNIIASAKPAVSTGL